MSGVWAGVGGVVGLILLAVWVLTTSDIIRSHLGRGQTAAWLIVVLLLPFVGAALYWALRKPSGQEIQYQVDSERALREAARRQPFDHSGLG